MAWLWVALLAVCVGCLATAMCRIGRQADEAQMSDEWRKREGR